MLIVVVEDDEDYGEIIAHTLRRAGNEVVLVHDTDGARRFVGGRSIDMAVLDVMLPDGSGLQFCQELRQRQPDVPILFLSSLDRSNDVVAGFDAGADDYLAKPFHPAELVARTRALGRRAGVSASAADTPGRSPIARDGFEIDPDAGRARFRGNDLGCSPIEVEILAQLLRYPGQALSNAFLTEKVWGYTNVADGSLLKGHISAIRKKLRDAGADEEAIRTVRGVGYAFSPA